MQSALSIWLDCNHFSTLRTSHDCAAGLLYWKAGQGMGGSGSHPQFHWPGFHIAVVSEWQGKLANYLLLQMRTSTSGSANSVQYHSCEKTFNNKEEKEEAEQVARQLEIEGKKKKSMGGFPHLPWQK